MDWIRWHERELTMKKPIIEEFELSRAGVRHLPTGERFTAFPGKPGDGTWMDGHEKGAADYDQEEVRQLGRKIWARVLAEKALSLKEPSQNVPSKR
jgi:hypothetical protein